jgi:hypothetical protein
MTKTEMVLHALRDMGAVQQGASAPGASPGDVSGHMYRRKPYLIDGKYYLSTQDCRKILRRKEKEGALGCHHDPDRTSYTYYYIKEHS